MVIVHPPKADNAPAEAGVAVVVLMRLSGAILQWRAGDHSYRVLPPGGLNPAPCLGVLLTAAWRWTLRIARPAAMG